MIYLDNGATSYPKPRQVEQAVAQAFKYNGANPGRSGSEMAVRTGDAIYNCRKNAANFFRADGPECVVFQPSCTYALNTVIKGVLKPGDNVVVSDLEHNAVMRPLYKLRSQGVTITVARTFMGNNDLTLNSFRKAMAKRTKLVVCTHASNVFGIRLPVERIAALAHMYGAKICVDAAQSAGVLPIDIQDSSIDYLCVPGHKGLYGPMGTGLLILREGDVIDTLIEGGTGSRSRIHTQPEDPPERYESGTLNVPGIMGLNAGLNFVRGMGIQKIYSHEMSLISWLNSRLSNMPGISLYTGRHSAGFFVPVLALNIDGMPSERAGEFLARRDISVRCGLHCAPAAHEAMGTREGVIRVSPSVFSTRRDMEFLAESLNQLRTMR